MRFPALAARAAPGSAPAPLVRTAPAARAGPAAAQGARARPRASVVVPAPPLLAADSTARPHRNPPLCAGAAAAEMATGDLEGNVERLRRELRRVKVRGDGRRGRGVRAGAAPGPALFGAAVGPGAERAAPVMVRLPPGPAAGVLADTEPHLPRLLRAHRPGRHEPVQGQALPINSQQSHRFLGWQQRLIEWLSFRAAAEQPRRREVCGGGLLRNERFFADCGSTSL